MARYLIGNGPNTWDFHDAYEAANEGDILEFEKGYAYTLSPGVSYYPITKSLTICGYAEIDETGGRIIHSQFYGNILVTNDVELTLQDICVYSNSDSVVIETKEGSKLTIINSIVGNIFEKNNKYVIVSERGSLKLSNVTFDNVESLNSNIKIEESNSVEIENTNLEHIFINKSENVAIKNCDFKYFKGNVLNVNESKLRLEQCYIEGGNSEKEWPALYLSNSEISAKGLTVIQKNFESAIYINNTAAILEDISVSSIKMHASRAKITNATIKEILYLSNMSLARVYGNLNILGEVSEKIDAYVGIDSVITVDKLILNRICSPNINIREGGYLRVKELVYEGGNTEELIIKTDETGEFDNLKQGQKNLRNTASDSQDEKLSALEQLNNLIGLKRVKKTINDMLRLVDYNNKRISQGLPPEVQSLHSVFVGNPGTGKTTVARLIGEILYGKGAISENKVIEVSRTDLVGSYKGHTGPQTRAILEKAKGGVLFIDEAYTLVTGEDDNFGQEAIDEILKFMEDNRDNIMIIFAGYTKEMDKFLKANSGLKSRVPNIFDFEDYTPDEIVKMGEKILGNGHYTFEDKDYYEKYVKRAYSASLEKSNGRWIRNINEKIKKALGNRVIETNSEDITTIKNVDIDEVINSGKYQEDGRKKDAYEELKNLIGIKTVKEQIEQFIARAEVNKIRTEQGRNVTSTSLHSLFLGNPGTGKTTVARIIGELLYQKDIIAQNKFIEVSRTDLVGSHVGHTAQKTRNVLESALGGVLFIDEAYALSTGGDNDFGREALDEILKFMEDYRDNIVIIFAGYTKEMEEFLNMNSGLRSRIPNVFDFEDYTPDEIVKIGLLGLKRSEYSVDQELYTKAVKDLYKETNDNSNGRWIRNINEKLIMYMSTRVARSGAKDLDEITKEDLKMLRGGDIDDSNDALTELNKLIGINKVKEQVEQFIALAEVNKRREDQGNKITSFSLHSLFLGNPGTGKTTVARIVGKVLYQKGIIKKDRFVEVSRTDLVAGYVGQTAEKTRKVLESARGGVLFIDEAYSLSVDGFNDFGSEAIDEILKFMEDNRGDIVIIFAGYTKPMENFINMNSGLRSRIPNTFDFENYTESEIVEIGLLGLRNLNYNIDEVFYRKIIKELYVKTNDNSNGRWIRNINEKLIINMSTRVVRNGGDINTILPIDIEKIKESIDG